MIDSFIDSSGLTSVQPRNDHLARARAIMYGLRESLNVYLGIVIRDWGTRQYRKMISLCELLVVSSYVVRCTDVSTVHFSTFIAGKRRP